MSARPSTVRGALALLDRYRRMVGSSVACPRFKLRSWRGAQMTASPTGLEITRGKACYRFWIEAFTSHDLNAVSFPSVVDWPLVLCPQIGGESRRRGRYTNFYQLRGMARSRGLSL